MTDKELQEKAAKWDVQQAKAKLYAARQTARYTLILQKSAKAGIVVTEAEIDAAIKAKVKK